MWADNETIDDLLGFKVHCDLVLDVVTDPDILPVVFGVFGDWGGGKSSIMRMLEHQLKDRKGVACLYFNGWMFEGYEDAKTALLSSILVAIGENERFGPKVKKKVVGLLQRVRWMDVARMGVKHVGVPLAVAAMTGGATAIPAAFSTLAAGLLPGKKEAADAQPEKKEGDKEDKGETNWSDLINADETKPDLLEVRKFREDFEALLADTNIDSLIVLIDDLDRCLPDRIIETLEAIKLFVAVPKTAFVIGADERIVRHAIATRYARQQLDQQVTSRDEEYDLTRDYLEKLIQIPYHLPRLSPAEMESYVNLLLCQKLLTKETFSQVVVRWNGKRADDFYAAFSYGAVQEALNGVPMPEDLGEQLEWSNRVSTALTEGLKGNPRQVKRMLNAMQLRRRLSKVARLQIKPDVLAKLMVLEYTHEDLFRHLNDWQTLGKGFPEELKQLEDAAAKEETLEIFSKWNKPGVQRWLQMPPLLSAIDLRDYFWIARDRTKSTLAGASMVSPLVNAIYRQFIGGNEGEQVVAVGEAQKLELPEMDSLLSLLGQHVSRHAEEDAAPDALRALVEAGVAGADSTLFDALQTARPDLLSASVVQNVATMGRTRPALREQTERWLRSLAEKRTTGAGAAAEIALQEFQEPVQR